MAPVSEKVLSGSGYVCIDEMALGCIMVRGPVGGGSVMLWATFYWETLDPGIHEDVNLPHTSYLQDSFIYHIVKQHTVKKYDEPLLLSDCATL